MSKVEITRRRLQLIRDAARIYLEGKDKHDPKVAAVRREMADDARYFHNKWLAAKNNG